MLSLNQRIRLTACLEHMSPSQAERKLGLVAPKLLSKNLHVELDIKHEPLRMIGDEQITNLKRPIGTRLAGAIAAAFQRRSS